MRPVSGIKLKSVSVILYKLLYPPMLNGYYTNSQTPQREATDPASNVAKCV